MPGKEGKLRPVGGGELCWGVGERGGDGEAQKQRGEARWWVEFGDTRGDCRPASSNNLPCPLRSCCGLPATAGAVHNARQHDGATWSRAPAAASYDRVAMYCVALA
eukprot:351017-Chlamydomonas_euryale.AAC.6